MANPTVTPIMTPARGPGVPDAQPVYYVDIYGNVNGIVGSQPLLISTGGTQAKTVTPTSLTVISANPGRLARILVTVINGANAILIYDNATTGAGTVIGIVPANAAVGTVVDCQMPALNGITIAATASAGTITVGWS